MTQILRVKVNWTGFIGSPGYTNLHFRDFSEGDVTQEMADGAVLRTDTWLDAWPVALPSVVSILVDPVVDVLNAENGQLEGSFNTSPDTARVGSGAGTYSAPTGMVVNWQTGVIKNGRRIRGRTFMVPITSTATDPTGTINNTVLTTLRTATATFIGVGPVGVLGVWSRPTPAAPESGLWATVNSFNIPDKCAVLRSRRD
jgi:hypothetical protein